MKPQITCERALVCMSSLAAGEPSFTSPEVDELLKFGLILEVDLRDLETMQWLAPLLAEHTKCEVRDVDVIERVKAALDHVNEQLRSDWFRTMHRHSTLAAREQDRQDLRRAYGIVNDAGERKRLAELVDTARANRDPTFAGCPALGREQFALTLRGRQVAADLQLKLSRFGSFPLATFMKSFDKADAKMAALVNDVELLHRSVSGSAKHPHQVVIGLVKSGLPPDEAVHSYASAMRSTYDPGTAVTYARNAAAHGGEVQVGLRLEAAQNALERAGVPMNNITRNAAKALLPLPSFDDGAVRFRQIAHGLVHLGWGDVIYKMTARLLPAAGTPEQVVHRALAAFNQLPKTYRLEHHAICGAALAALVDNEQALPALTRRLVDIVNEMVRRQVYQAPDGLLDALECVTCPGTPAEVVETVVMLLAKLDTSTQLTGSNKTAVAVAFAKRFAY